MNYNKIQIWILHIFILIGYSSVSVAQPGPKEMDKTIQTIFEKWDIPGMSVGIVAGDSIFLAKGYGHLERGKNNKVNEHTLFAIASNTKAFVASSLAILVQEGKLSWDDKVQKYLPDFKLYDSYVSADATIRDLLCHRAGLGTFSGDVNWYKNKRSPQELMPAIAALDQAYSFRSGYGYSNLMFIMAGEVIRVVSGLSWDEFVNSSFFAHLDMDRSVTSVHELEALSNVATPHRYLGDETLPIAWVDWDNMGAAGGIISSARDMCQWMRMQLNKGVYENDTILRRNVQLDTWTSHNTFKVSDASRSRTGNRQFSGYGLGWSISDYHGKLTISHGGGYDGMYSKVLMIPDLNLGIVVLTNSMKGISTWLCNTILDEFLQVQQTDWNTMGLEAQKRSDRAWKDRRMGRENARVANTKSSLPLASFAGKYTCPMFGDIVVKMKGEKLYIDFMSGPDLNASLSHWHYDTFKLEWDQIHAWFDFGTVQFTLDNNQKVTGLLFDVPNDDIFFEEIKAVRQP